ncbi:MAG: hypothetical protein HWE23_06470 [Rhodobacteraceae bacterium]|nr:hypothetical protein [Paracoccaceae bacterium]
MEGDYNFWQDFFDRYQSLSDWMKMLWLVVPPAFVLGLIALVMRMRINSKRADHVPNRLWTYNDERPSMAIGGIAPAMKLKVPA